MSMPPRSRTGSGPLVAGLIIVTAVVVAVAVLASAGITVQRAWDSFFPVGGTTPATEQGRDIKTLYDIVFYIAAAIFFVVEGVIIFTVFRYRRKPGDDELPPQTHGNNLVEVLWTAIPTVIVAFLFVLSWQTLNTVQAAPTPDVHIRAVAARFQWSFDYLDVHGNTLFTQNLPVGEGGGMVVPVGESVNVSLKSEDVIHAFYVPKFLFKRDVVPGKDNTFDFTVDEPGTYRGQCAELCGAFHGSMVFDVNAIPKADFDAWFQAQIERASATPTPPPEGGGGPALEISAQNIEFDTDALRAPADTPFQIHFVNNDAKVPHNVTIDDGSGNVVFPGENLTGPGEITYSVPALPAGTYPFLCTVHPNMTGTLTVE